MKNPVNMSFNVPDFLSGLPGWESISAPLDHSGQYACSPQSGARAVALSIPLEELPMGGVAGPTGVFLKMRPISNLMVCSVRSLLPEKTSNVLVSCASFHDIGTR